MRNSIYFVLAIMVCLISSCKEEIINNDFSNKPGSIKGHALIVNLTAKESISNSDVKVWIPGTNYETTTDSKGYLLLDSAHPGIYDIYFYKEGCDTSISFAFKYIGNGIASGGSTSLYMIPDGITSLNSVSIKQDTITSGLFHLILDFSLENDRYSTLFIDTTENVSKTRYLMLVNIPYASFGSHIFGFDIKPAFPFSKGQNLYVTAYSGSGLVTTDYRIGLTHIVGLGKQSKVVSCIVK